MGTSQPSACLLLQSTGVEFPEVTAFWDGDKMRSVGAGVRAKKFAFVPVKVTFIANSTASLALFPACLTRLAQAWGTGSVAPGMVGKYGNPGPAAVQRLLSKGSVTLYSK